MKLGGVRRFGLGLVAGAALAIATGCSTAGWGPAPASGPVAAQQGAPAMVQTTGMRLTEKEAQATVPPWIRIQDCTIVAISSPDRYACPDGKVYTNYQLSRARTGEYVLPPLPPPAPIVVNPLPEVAAASSTEKIILRGVHFDFNKADIRPQDAAVLDEAAGTLKSHPDVAVNVNGYCDSIGGVRYNLGLSQRRAGAVVHYLADHGVAEGRLSPQGYGKTDFIASNSSDEGRAQNRRVEMVPNSTGKVFIMGTPGSR
jgi:outer membrane protein OmpA-like peptidoglycan-associated protein